MRILLSVAAIMGAMLLAQPASAKTHVSVSFGDAGHYRHDRHYQRHDRHRGHYGHDRHWRRPPVWNRAAYYYPAPVVRYVQPVVETRYIYVQPPARPVAQEQGYCREYQSVTTIGGVARSAYGTACLQPDGSWAVAN